MNTQPLPYINRLRNYSKQASIYKGVDPRYYNPTKRQQRRMYQKGRKL